MDGLAVAAVRLAARADANAGLVAQAGCAGIKGAGRGGPQTVGAWPRHHRGMITDSGEIALKLVTNCRANPL